MAGQTVQDAVQSTDHIQLLISNRARLWNKTGPGIVILLLFGIHVRSIY